MQITVAAILTPDMLGSARAGAEELPDLRLLTDIYHNPNEAPALVQRYRAEADVFLFGGPIPYLTARAALRRDSDRLHQPLLFVPYTEVSLYRGLFQLMRDAAGDTGPRRHPVISIDYPQVSEIGGCLDELELPRHRIHTWECGPEASFDDLITFHAALWRTGRTHYMMSSIYSVYEELKRRELPVYRISPAKSQIRNALQRALLGGQARRQAEHQLAVGTIGFDVDRPGATRPSAFQRRQRKRALADLLPPFEEQTQALVSWTDAGELRFVCTRGQVERVSNQFRSIPMLAAIRERLTTGTCIGIGFGRTAHEAEFRSQEACAKARLAGDGACFIIDSDGTVEGPLGHRDHLEYAGRSTDDARVELARRSGLSVATINRVRAFFDSPGRGEFSARELAAALGLTARSARRIIGRLQDNGFIHAVGEEQPATRGRPRRIYRAASPPGTSHPGTQRR